MQALRLFCDVAELRSFSRAAERNQITQSAVSQRIRQLEEQLSTDLLDRSVRPFALTEAGELLAADGRRLIERHDDLLHRVSSLETELKGRVIVDAIYSAGIDLLEQVKTDFVAAHPGVTVSIEYKAPEAVVEAVLSGACDLGIVSYPTQWKGLRVRSLRDERMGLVCGPDHSLSGRRRIRARALSNWSLLGFEATLPVSKAIRSYLREAGVKPHFSAVVDNIDTMKAMLGVTDSVAIIPLRTVQREVANGTLSALALSPALDRPMGIICSSSRRLSAAARALTDSLHSSAGPSACTDAGIHPQPRSRPATPRRPVSSEQSQKAAT